MNLKLFILLAAIALGHKNVDAQLAASKAKSIADTVTIRPKIYLQDLSLTLDSLVKKPGQTNTNGVSQPERTFPFCTAVITGHPGEPVFVQYQLKAGNNQAGFQSAITKVVLNNDGYAAVKLNGGTDWHLANIDPQKLGSYKLVISAGFAVGHTTPITLYSSVQF